MKKPDLTLAQVTATLVAFFGLLVAFGLDLSKEKQDAIVQVVTVGFPIWLAADAYIRGKRADNADKL